MEGTMGNEGINKLAGVLQGRMKSMAEQPASLDIGQIGSDMSLTTNQFPQPIPKNDYLVCRQLTLGPVRAELTTTAQDGSHSHPGVGGGGSHSHSVLIPEKMRKLKPGDRVLVAWLGDDACVIDIILPGSAL